MRKFSVALLSLAFLLAFQVGSAFASSKLDRTVDKLIGIQYNYGGTTTSGFDCSGFTQYVFRKLGVELPRTSRDQYGIGKSVARDDLRPGDLVFFITFGNKVSHVGVYVGDNKFAHADLDKGITIASLSEKYYAKCYAGAKRVMDADTYQDVAADPKADAPAHAPVEPVAAVGTDASAESN